MICFKHLLLFHLLDYCWEVNDISDDLPALLGEMSPYLHLEGTPMDNEVYNDWDNICVNLNDKKDLLNKVEQLLLLYEEKYHFNFRDTKKALANISDDEIANILNYCVNI